MSLFDGILEQYNTPQADPVPAPVQVKDQRPYVVTLKQASNGAEILLCNVTPPPAAALAEARAMKLPLFTFDEIPAMRQAAAADPGYIDALLTARRAFGWGGPITFTQETA